MGNSVIFSHEEDCQILFTDVVDTVPIADETGVNFFIVAGKKRKYHPFPLWIVVYRFTLGTGLFYLTR